MSNVTRLSLASSLGQSFDGSRDVYLSAGYSKTISIERIIGKVERQDIANRILSIFPSETWRKPPVILDGTDGKDARDDTPFVQAWNNIANPPPDFTSVSEKKSIWHYLQRADKLSLMGRYGILFVGVSGTDELKDPLPQNVNFAYLRSFSERRIILTESNLNKDASSSRFGMPGHYGIQFTDGISRQVHWSRCIHIAEELLDDEVYGLPILQKVWNRLDDLEQVMAGSKEAFWRLASKGLVLEQDPEARVSEEVSEEDLSKFVHGLTRTLELVGYKANVLGGESVDPGPMVMAIMMIIATSLGIPQNKLMGAQSGRLASAETDDDDWLDTIRARQILFAQPIILEPLINRLVYCGALPAPSSGNYFVKWPSLKDTSPSEDSENFERVAEGFKHLNDAEAERFVDVGEVIRTFLPTFDPGSVNDQVAPKSTVEANVRGVIIPSVPEQVRITDEDADEAMRAWDDAETGLDEILDAE